MLILSIVFVAGFFIGVGSLALLYYWLDKTHLEMLCRYCNSQIRFGESGAKNALLTQTEGFLLDAIKHHETHPGYRGTRH